MITQMSVSTARPLFMRSASHPHGIREIEPLCHLLPGTEAVDDPGRSREQVRMGGREIVCGEELPAGLPLDLIDREIRQVPRSA